MKEKKVNSNKPSKVKQEKNSNRQVAFSKKKTRKIASFLVFGVMTISLLFNVIHFSKVQTIRNMVQASYEEIDEQVKGIEVGSLIDSQKLVVYTDDFVQEYINLPKGQEEREERIDKLRSYFIAGFDVSNLENTSEFVGSRSIDRIRFLDVNRTDSHEAKVHYLVSYKVTEIEEIETEKVKKEKDEDGQTKEVKETDIVEEEKVTEYDVELIVPVVTDGEGFAVTNHPSLISSDIKADIQYKQSPLEGEDTTAREREALTPFLNDFFTAYGLSDEKLAFMADVDQGLTNKVYEELNITDSVRNDNEYILRVQVTFRDRETSLLSVYSYELLISEQNRRFFVQDIN